MAKKYGGQYSPEGARTNARAEQNGRGSVLQRVNVPMRKALRRLGGYRVVGGFIGVAGVLKLLTGAPFAGMLAIASFFAIILATEITKAGLEAEEAYNNRTIARAPAFPRKLIGAVLMGVIALLTSKFSVGTDWLTAIGLSLATGIGMVMAFGLDPMRAKGMSGENRYQAGRTAEAIEKAQSYLDQIRALANDLPDRRAKLEIENLAISAEEMFQALENDPSDLRNSKRYLGVYLQGARDATEQFLQLPKTEQTAEAEAKYLALIRELDEGFRKKRETILQDNRNSLDVEIDVLRERLASEGIKIPKEENS